MHGWGDLTGGTSGADMGAMLHLGNTNVHLELIPKSFEEFRYSIVISDGQIEYQAHRLNGDVLFNFVYALPDLVVSDIDQVTIGLYTTILDPLWMDDVVITATQSGSQSSSQTVAAPVVTGLASGQAGQVTVGIECATAGARIYYTIDGTLPTTSATLYAGPFELSSARQVRAFAVKEGLSNSSYANEYFDVALVVSAPIISPNGGTSAGPVTVTLSCDTSGSAIYYTINGASSSTLYTGPFVLSSSSTVQAMATKTGYSSSALVSAAFTITQSLPTVTTSPVSGISQNSATGGGNVTSDGGATVTERGVVIGNAAGLTISNGTKIPSGSGTGSYTGTLSGLQSGMTYYVRAYAINSVGVGYGSELNFSTIGSKVLSLTGSLGFGNVAVGATATRTFTIGNSGSTALNVSGISYPSGFSGAWSGSVAAGGSQTVTVTFAPVSASSYGGNLSVSSDATSGTATLAVSGTGTSAAPVISTHPSDAVVVTGGSVTYAVTATGSTPLTYQWYFTPKSSIIPQTLSDLSGKLSGTHGASLTVSNAQAADEGDYVCIVTDGNSQQATSHAALLSIAVRVVRVAGQTVSPGSTVVVSIMLDAHGEENALGFSLSFDPTQLTYQSAVAGAQAADATLNLNSSQSSSGRLGVALAKPAGLVWGAGTQEIVRVTFVVNAALAGGVVSNLVFGDAPVAREVGNASAQALPAGYQSGAVTVLSGYEADMNGNGTVSITDWVKVGRIVAGLDPAPTGVDFKKADCAPRSSLGNGSLSITDWVQAGRYAAGLDPLTPVGGPSAP